MLRFKIQYYQNNLCAIKHCDTLWLSGCFTCAVLLGSWQHLYSGELGLSILKMRRLRLMLHNYWVIEPGPKARCSRTGPVPSTALFKALIHICFNHKTLGTKLFLGLPLTIPVRWGPVDYQWRQDSGGRSWIQRNFKGTQRCWKTHINDNFL